MMAVMVMLYTTVLSTKMKNADGWSGHGGGEAEGQWIHINQNWMQSEFIVTQHKPNVDLYEYNVELWVYTDPINV